MLTPETDGAAESFVRRLTGDNASHVVSYGTGTPVADGITPDEGKTLLGTLLSDPKLGCFEIVEVNPLLDNKKNTMAETALGVLEKAVETLENR